jgi:hypothetical protein
MGILYRLQAGNADFTEMKFPNSGGGKQGYQSQESQSDSHKNFLHTNLLLMRINFTSNSDICY